MVHAGARVLQGPLSESKKRSCVFWLPSKLTSLHACLMTPFSTNVEGCKHNGLNGDMGTAFSVTCGFTAKRACCLYQFMNYHQRRA